MSLLSQGSLCLSPPLQCRWQTCQVTITSISEPCCPHHRIWLHWVTLIPRPPLFLIHRLFYASQPGALSRQMDSLPSRALPSGTLTHRMSPTPTSSAWLPVRALPTPSLFLSHSTPNIYVSDSRQHGDHCPEQLLRLAQSPFLSSSFPSVGVGD